MLETFFSTLSGIADSISMFIQFVIHELQHIVFFIINIGKGVQFLEEAVLYMPFFFSPIITVVLAIMVIRAILSRE